MSIYVAEESLYSYPYDTMVGLMDEDEINSASSSSNFVEIYVNKAWGPVCNLGMVQCVDSSNAFSVDEMNSTS